MNSPFDASTILPIFASLDIEHAVPNQQIATGPSTAHLASHIAKSIIGVPIPDAITVTGTPWNNPVYVSNYLGECI